MQTDPDFVLTAGDTGPAITAQLQDGAGAAVNLTGATVRFRMTPIVAAAPALDAAASIDAAATGNVSFAWRAGDTAVPGDYLARWRVTYANAVVESFPDDGPLLVRIKAAV